MTSTNDFDRRLYALFNEALDLAPEARSQMLDALRAEEPLLADRLARMLEADLQGEERSDTTASLHAALAVAMDASQPGELPALIGGYRIEGKLGEGGMGVVYLARREGLRDAPAVALKLISERLRSSAAQERFIAEQRSLARLDHPAVCRFIDADTLPDGRPLVVMEAVRGMAIDEWVATERPSVRTLLGLFIQLLSAVAHAHERLIVHRDIKCSNVLVTSSGQIKLLDFGIAKLMDEADTAQATATSDRFLTPGIAAPEYWARGEVTVATDIYALGALLYRLLSARDPLQFEGLKPTEIERKLLFVEPEPLNKVASFPFKSEISNDLEAVVHKCLRKTASERYSSADALASDLRCLLGGFPVQARTAPLLYQARLYFRRHRFAATLATAVALVLLAWGLSLSASLREIERQRAEAVRSREASDQIAQLLESAITEADPARRSIQEVTAKEIMSAAAERVEALQDSAPDTYIRLALVIARIQMAYGLNHEAYALGKKAIDSGVPNAALPQIDELRVLTALARVRTGNSDEASNLLDALSSSFPKRSALYLVTRASIMLENMEHQSAISMLMEAIQGEGYSDPYSQSHHELRWKLADAYERQGDKQSAVGTLTQTLQWQLADLPAEHAWVLHTRLKRLQPLETLSPGPTTDKEYEEVLTSIRALYGSDSPDEALLLARRGSAQNARGEFRASAETLEEAVRIRLLTKPFTDAGHLRMATNLGSSLLSAGDPASITRAMEVLTPVEATVSEQFGSGQSFAIYVRALLARAMLKSSTPCAAVKKLSSTDLADDLNALAAWNRKFLLETIDLALLEDDCTRPPTAQHQLHILAGQAEMLRNSLLAE